MTEVISWLKDAPTAFKSSTATWFYSSDSRELDENDKTYKIYYSIQKIGHEDKKIVESTIPNE